MSFSHGNQAVFKLDNAGGTLTDYSAYIHNVEMPIERDDTELPVIGGGAVSRLVGPYKSTIKVEGWYDPTIDAVLGAAIVAATPATKTWEYAPAGTASGLPKYTGEAYLMNYEPDTDAEDAAEWSIELVVDGAITRSTY